jgi:hypothetical protein
LKCIKLYKSAEGIEYLEVVQAANQFLAVTNRGILSFPSENNKIIEQSYEILYNHVDAENEMNWLQLIPSDRVAVGYDAGMINIFPLHRSTNRENTIQSIQCGENINLCASLVNERYLLSGGMEMQLFISDLQKNCNTVAIPIDTEFLSCGAVNSSSNNTCETANPPYIYSIAHSSNILALALGSGQITFSNIKKFLHSSPNTEPSNNSTASTTLSKNAKK